ncbi:MAG: serine hydrolase, partial [Patescibacteria group bacterium]
MKRDLLKKTFAALVAVAGMGGSFAIGAAGVALMHAPAPAYGAPALKNIAVQAKAAILYDVHSGTVLYQKNATMELPLASLTKLMAAQAALAVQDPKTLVEITADTLRPEGDSGLRQGDAYELNDLVRLALVASSNDAAAAAAASLGGDYLLAMNSAARQLGLTKTHFLNPTGLDVHAQKAGAYRKA